MSVDRANPMLTPERRHQATYAFGLPFPAKRGTALTSGIVAPGFSTCRVDHVGGVAVITSSEKVVEISTPPGITLPTVRLDQARRTRPVSGSASISSLSAASRALFETITPVGFVAGGTSNGPVQVWP